MFVQMFHKMLQKNPNFMTNPIMYENTFINHMLNFMYFYILEFIVHV